MTAVGPVDVAAFGVVEGLEDLAEKAARTLSPQRQHHQDQQHRQRAEFDGAVGVACIFVQRRQRQDAGIDGSVDAEADDDG